MSLVVIGARSTNAARQESFPASYFKTKRFADIHSLIHYSGDAHVGPLRVLHIAPISYSDPECFDRGARKDIDGRQQYLRASGAPFDTFLQVTDHCRLKDELSFFTTPDYTHIIIEGSRPREDFVYLKKRWPYAKLIFRSHHVEILHRVDRLRALRRIMRTRDEVRAAVRAIGAAVVRERAAAEFADVILHAEPDATLYWRSLGFTKLIIAAPHFLTEPYLKRVESGTQRKNQVLCLASPRPEPLTLEMLANYHAAVAALGDRAPDFEFLATGKLPERVRAVRESARVKHLGRVELLPQLLAETKAIAVTSSLGRGFNTRVLEAATSGVWSIIPPQLMKRTPPELQPFCLVLDPGRPGGSLEAVLEEMARRPWPKGDPNAIFRRRADKALDHAIFGVARSDAETSDPS